MAWSCVRRLGKGSSPRGCLVTGTGSLGSGHGTETARAVEFFGQCSLRHVAWILDGPVWAQCQVPSNSNSMILWSPPAFKKNCFLCINGGQNTAAQQLKNIINLEWSKVYPIHSRLLFCLNLLVNLKIHFRACKNVDS